MNKRRRWKAKAKRKAMYEARRFFAALNEHTRRHGPISFEFGAGSSAG